MLDIKYRFTCGDSDLSEIIKRCQNIMARIVVGQCVSSLIINFEQYIKYFLV